jgi:putative effector of murein hydrolase
VIPHIIHSYVNPTIGVLIALCALYGVNVAILLTKVAIPASVICMLILFFGLLLLEVAIGTRKVSSLLKIINIPAGFSLRWMNVYFTSPFILLPLAQKVGVAEAFEIGAVVVIGFIVMMIVMSYMAWGLQRLSNTRRKAHDDASEQAIELSEMTRNNIGTPNAINHNLPSISTATSSEPTSPSTKSNISPVASSVLSNDTNAFTSDPSSIQSLARTTSQDSSSVTDPAPPPPPPPRLASSHRPSVSLPPLDSNIGPQSSHPVQQPHPPSRSRRIANWMPGMFDWLFYSVMFMIGLPIYYVLGYTLPLHLSIVVLSFRAALLVPSKYRLVIHPILLCSGVSILSIYVAGVIRGQTLQSALQDFKTGRTYLTLFTNSSNLPGAGDVLSTLLDVSIVSLAVPMYQYRADLKRHFAVLIVATSLAGLVSFFAFAPLSYAVGISQTRSLAFIARSATLALALPVVEAVGGSTSLVAVVTILSGILGVFFGGLILGKRGLRFREDDFVTRGICTGVCSGAIGSVHLLSIDPRASALSSLSFFLYGIILIVLSAIPPVVHIVRSWVGLS